MKSKKFLRFKTRKFKDHHVVSFHIGVQSFTLNTQCESKEHAHWYIKCLSHAFDKMIARHSGKELSLLQLRRLINQYGREEITLSRMLEIINSKIG